MHIVRSCDYLSKVGTKKRAETNLRTFGEGVSLTQEQLDEAEKYLVNVYHRVKIMRIDS